MGLVKRKNNSGGTQPQYADSTTSTKLFKSDQAKFDQLCLRQQKSPAEVLRQIVSEALTRQEMLARDEQNSEGVSRRLIEDLMADQLRPFRQDMQDLKGCLKEIASMVQASPSTPAPEAEEEMTAMVERVLIAINENLTGLYQNQSDFLKVLKSSSVVQDRTERWSQAAYALNGHTFIWTPMILDLLIRYVVIPQLKVMEPDADAELVVKEELDAGRQKASKQRARLEKKLDIPNDGRVKFLSVPQE